MEWSGPEGSGLEWFGMFLPYRYDSIGNINQSEELLDEKLFLPERVTIEFDLYSHEFHLPIYNSCAEEIRPPIPEDLPSFLDKLLPCLYFRFVHFLTLGLFQYGDLHCGQ